MSVLTIRLPDKLREQWRDRCQKQGVSVSGAVRSVIESELITPAISITQRADKPQKKRRVPVWLTESEIEAIRVRTSMQGGNRAGWIVRAIRGALTRDPQLGETELQALRESNYQLLAIGNNLNQIARRLNERQSQQDVKPEQVTALRKSIDKHTDQVQAMIDANIKRWPLS